MIVGTSKTLGRITLIAIVLAAFTGFAIGTWAKEDPPEGGTPKPFNLPARETLVLDNGLKVSFIEFGVVPKVAVSVVVRTGNLNEGDDTWLADFTAEMMREGAGGKSAVEIANAAASMGGDVGISVGVDTTVAGIDVLSEFGPDAVALLADIVTRPALPESQLERIRADFLRNLSVAKSQPQSLAAEAFADLIYGDHAYGTAFASEEQINSYTIEDIRGYYGANFGARRTHVYVAGIFDIAAMTAAIEAAFAGWGAGPDILLSPPEPQSGKRVELLARPGAPQSTVRLGLPVIDVTHEDYVPLVVTNTLLGGYFSSRITSNIREDKGYTYSPFSRIENRYHDAVWSQQADVTTAQTGAALKEIYYEIDRLQAEAPSTAELTSIKNYRAGVFVLQNATRTGLIRQLSAVDLQGLDDSYLSGYVDRVFAVSPEQVSAMANQYLRDEDMALVVVGDLETVRPQLAELPQLEGALPE